MQRALESKERELAKSSSEVLALQARIEHESTGKDKQENALRDKIIVLQDQVA